MAHLATFRPPIDHQIKACDLATLLAFFPSLCLPFAFLLGTTQPRLTQQRLFSTGDCLPRAQSPGNTSPDELHSASSLALAPRRAGHLGELPKAETSSSKASRPAPNCGPLATMAESQLVVGGPTLGPLGGRKWRAELKPDTWLAPLDWPYCV